MSSQTSSPPTFSAQLANVIVKWPLYRKFEFAGEQRMEWAATQSHGSYFPLPRALFMYCGTNQCRHEQPWDIIEPAEGKAYPNHGPLYPVTYKCRACYARQDYWLLLKADANGGYVTKAGQFPPLALEPPSIVAAGMDDEELKFYRQALILRNANFGIAAVAYLRRIVENRTNALLDLIAARQRDEDPESPLLDHIDEAKEDRRFTSKLEFAAELLPKSVRLGGQNPVSILHALTSEALHSLSDEESVDV